MTVDDDATRYTRIVAHEIDLCMCAWCVLQSLLSSTFNMLSVVACFSMEMSAVFAAIGLFSSWSTNKQHTSMDSGRQGVLVGGHVRVDEGMASCVIVMVCEIVLA
jgi:hypothetical protein